MFVLIEQINFMNVLLKFPFATKTCLFYILLKFILNFVDIIIYCQSGAEFFPQIQRENQSSETHSGLIGEM